MIMLLRLLNRCKYGLFNYRGAQRVCPKHLKRESIELLLSTSCPAVVEALRSVPFVRTVSNTTCNFVVSELG